MLALLIVLHSGAGTPLDLNVEAITHMRGPEVGNKLFSTNVKCQINLVDGKFVAVRETCAEVRRLMMEARK